jgi:hypothetical protein
MPSFGNVSSLRCPSETTPTVIHATANTRLGSDSAQAAMNKMKGKQISNVERVFILFSPGKSGFFPAYSRTESRRIRSSRERPSFDLRNERFAEVLGALRTTVLAK